MTFYHGSPIGGLNKLEPFLSEHGRHYIYFATNPLVALLYAVKPVPKPNRSALLNRYMQNPFKIACGDGILHS